MRLLIFALVLTVAAWTSTAQANTLNFGAANGAATSCSLAGSSGDRSCTHSATVSNGANDTTASAQIVAQASADHAVAITDGDAIADMTVSYTIPYTVTRTWNTVPGPAPQLVIPTQQITLDLTYSGNTAHDNSQVGGGLANALMQGATVTSARFGSVVLNDASSSSGGGGVETGGALTDTLPDLGGSLGRNASGPGVGEISFAFQIPTDYRDWQDVFEPTLHPVFSWNSTPYSGTQSLTDTLTITFRLRAESRPSGSISTTGGEAIACAGQTSPLGGFLLDGGLACGSGLQIAASVAQTGTTSALVPEPGTLMLIGSGLAGLVAFGVRRKS